MVKIVVNGNLREGQLFILSYTNAEHWICSRPKILNAKTQTSFHKQEYIPPDALLLLISWEKIKSWSWGCRSAQSASLACMKSYHRATHPRCGCTATTPALGRQRRDDQEFKVIWSDTRIWGQPGIHGMLWEGEILAFKYFIEKKGSLACAESPDHTWFYNLPHRKLT